MLSPYAVGNDDIVLCHRITAPVAQSTLDIGGHEDIADKDGIGREREHLIACIVDVVGGLVNPGKLNQHRVGRMVVGAILRGLLVEQMHARLYNLLIVSNQLAVIDNTQQGGVIASLLIEYTRQKEVIILRIRVIIIVGRYLVQAVGIGTRSHREGLQ